METVYSGNMRIICFLFLFALVVAGTSCDGDSGTADDPRTTAQVDIGLHQLNAQDTVLEAALRFDGVELDRFSAQAGTEPVGLQGNAENIQPGRHTIEIVIIRQTSSPNRYLFNGSVLYRGTRVQIPQPFPQGNVTTGQSLTTSIDL